MYNLILGAVGIVNLAPCVGLLGPTQLQKLYGIPLTDANLVLLMRHRAVLFGLTGTFILTAAFWRPQWQGLAVAAGLSSMLSFVALAVTFKGALNAEMRKVLVVDSIASAALIAATFFKHL